MPYYFFYDVWFILFLSLNFWNYLLKFAFITHISVTGFIDLRINVRHGRFDLYGKLFRNTQFPNARPDNAPTFATQKRDRSVRKMQFQISYFPGNDRILPRYAGRRYSLRHSTSHCVKWAVVFLRRAIFRRAKGNFTLRISLDRWHY